MLWSWVNIVLHCKFTNRLSRPCKRSCRSCVTVLLLLRHLAPPRPLGLRSMLDDSVLLLRLPQLARNVEAPGYAGLPVWLE